MEEMISNELQITPHLLALESLTNTTPASLNSASLASGVVNRFALNHPETHEHRERERENYVTFCWEDFPLMWPLPAMHAMQRAQERGRLSTYEEAA